MSKHIVRFEVRLDLAVTVDVDDADLAEDEAWKLANEYLGTVNGDHRAVVASGSVDGIGSYETVDVT
jgi:hypothetical protein